MATVRGAAGALCRPERVGMDALPGTPVHTAAHTIHPPRTCAGPSGESPPSSAPRGAVPSRRLPRGAAPTTAAETRARSRAYWLVNIPSPLETRRPRLDVLFVAIVVSFENQRFFPSAYFPAVPPLGVGTPARGLLSALWVKYGTLAFPQANGWLLLFTPGGLRTPEPGATFMRCSMQP
jgi:hypothetical protein